MATAEAGGGAAPSPVAAEADGGAVTPAAAEVGGGAVIPATAEADGAAGPAAAEPEPAAGACGASAPAPGEPEPATRDGAVAALKDQYGISTQNLTSSSTGTITFGGDPGYCATAGTYHYTVHGATLTFRVVSDSCGSRRDLLTPPWRRV